MKKFFLSSLACFATVAFSAAQAWALSYDIDADHSSVGFKIRHLAISSVTGKFLGFKGTFEYDPKDVAASKVEATVDVSSIDTAQKKRDDHLRSGDFFDIAHFPQMKFVSKKITDVTAEGFKVVGDLSIRDVTKEVVLDVTTGGTAVDPWGNERAAFTAETQVNRREYGLNYNKVLETGGLVVGDEVTILLEVEGIKKKAS